MKKATINIKRFNWLALAIVLMMGTITARAQSDTTKKEEVVMLSPSLDLLSVQKADNSLDLRFSMKVKFKGSSIKLPYLKVKFLAITDSAEKELGYAITNKVGAAIFNTNATAIPLNKEGQMHIKAVFAGNKSMEGADAELTFKKAKLDLTPVKEDSTYSATLKLVDLSSGTEKPVADVTVGLFVKRSFFPMKIGEGKTDSTGTVSIEIPSKLAGDSAGNIVLIGKVDENEVFGNLEASSTQKWGLANSVKNEELPRALWSSHPPIWMLVVFIILMATVWGHYIIIVYELFRLRKEEPKSPAPEIIVS